MENQQQSANALCRANCGFFGSSSTDGFCSKCFKDTITKKQDTGRISPPSITSAVHGQGYDLKAQLEAAVASAQSSISADVVSSSLSSSSSSASLAIETTLSESASPAETSTPVVDSKPKVNRCHVCKKRVGLTGFACRCSGMFCAEHRYETEHNCQFDYKKAERELIAKNNPVVRSEKIQQI